MTRVVDSYLLGDRTTNPRIRDIVSSSSSERIGYIASNAIITSAIKEIESGKNSSPTIATALSLLVLHEKALFEVPTLLANNFMLFNFLEKSGIKVPIHGNARVIGCGVLPIEASAFEYPFVNQGAERAVIDYLKVVEEKGIRDSVLGRDDRQIKELQKHITTVNVVTGVIHFSDPVWDPMKFDLTKQDKDRRKEFETTLPAGIFPNAEAVFWGKTLADIAPDGLPSTGGMFTADSVQTLHRTGSKADALFALKFDPEICNGTDIASRNKSFTIYTNLRNALSEFASAVISQVNDGGILVMTLGRGNNEEERLNRRIFALALAKLLPSTSTTWILGPEEYANTVSGIPNSTFAAKTKDDRQYLMVRLPSEFVACTVNEELRRALEVEIERGVFQKLVYQAGRDTQKLGQLIR